MKKSNIRLQAGDRKVSYYIRIADDMKGAAIFAMASPAGIAAEQERLFQQFLQMIGRQRLR
jgi:hypothetical protein